ncbi:Peptidase family M1 [Actinacidiphila yanglinensis]|uniref:Aminopeptidase N n=1 Tax=Actinacidiphila yanglinensis TaxID=310779 RepID=A0A1H6CXT2_9ACTN|nr:M1 family metallopeptidase [Actinacidiphila yanglinensis]SEG77607.1 Peptidase family M1 [Actinacidiphila yanglinensis]
MRLRPPPRAVLLPLLAGCLLASCLSCTGGGSGGPATGAPGVGDRLFPDAGNGGYDVGHYTLDLGYDPASGRLRGTATLTATADRDLARFNLDLAGLDVRSVTVDGAAARAGRDGTELQVRPAHPLRHGARFTTVVDYQGTPRLLTDADGSHEGWIRTDDGALALGEPVGSMAWFPGNDHPSDKAAYDITVTVPHGLTAVSNGELLSTRAVSGDRTAYHWRTSAPMATYLATVAIGHFDVTRSKTPDGLPLYVAVDPRSDDTKTSAALARIPEILAWEEGLFGPYPFASAGAVVDHLPRGRVGYALETQNRPVFPGDGPPPAVDPVTLVHELSHQWFGDSVTPAAWQDMWLNEGFATLTEWLWQQHEGGPSLDASAAAAFADSANWAFPPATPPDAASVSAPPVYGRGALVLYELRRTLGPSAFGRLLKEWPAAHRHGNASTAQFTAFCARFTSKDVTPLFRTWLYGAAKPSHL